MLMLAMDSAPARAKAIPAHTKPIKLAAWKGACKLKGLLGARGLGPELLRFGV